MKSTIPKDEPPPICPPFSLPSSSSDSSNLCWACSIFCCCFPLCYPCYLSRTLRKRNKMKKKLPRHHSQDRKRSRKGQEDYRRSNPFKSDKSRLTSTMNSEQSTGTSGYGTLLSRKGTLVTVIPNVDSAHIQEALLRRLDSSSACC